MNPRLEPDSGPACPLCGSPRTVFRLRSMPDRLHPASGAMGSITACQDCRAVFTVVHRPGNPYPPDYEPFQPLLSRPHRQHPTRDRIRRTFLEGKGTPWEQIVFFIPSLAYRARDRFKLRNRRLYLEAFRRRGRILDVGCGRGHHLREWMRFQDEGIGVEPVEAVARRARQETGLDIRAGTLEGQAFPSESFDAIAFCHVLEHVDDPRSTLREARRVLKPGGEIVLWLPNLDSLLRPPFGRDWMPYDVPRHLWHFTPLRLARLLKECGLQPVEIAPIADEYAFRRSVRLLRSSGYRLLSWILNHRWIRMLLGGISLWLRAADVMRVRARRLPS